MTSAPYIVEYQHWTDTRSLPTWQSIASIDGVYHSGLFSTRRAAAESLHDGVIRQRLRGRVPMGTIRIRRIDA